MKYFKFKYYLQKNKNIFTSNEAFRITAIYVLFGCLWILFSDKILEQLFNVEKIITSLSMLKGWAYVIVTGIIIYLLINNALKKLKNAEKKLSESYEELSTIVQELKESEEKYRLVFENAPLGIVQFDNNGIITAVNNSVIKIIGSSKESLMGLNLMNLADKRVLNALIKTLSGESGYYEGPYLSTTSNKSFYIKSHAAPLKRNGVLSGGVGIIEDITELRHTRDMMLENDKLAIIGQMAAGVAHEIRNPLTSIKGFAELIIENFSENKSLAGYASIILDEANQANRVISDFLQLAGPREPELNQYSIEKLLQEVIDIVEPHAFLTNIKVEYEAKELPQCMIDRNQIKQVLLNICNNGIEATLDGGILKIKSEFLPHKNELYIDIKDTGCGIPQDKLNNIGVPFYTTKDKGTGLGLSISYAIINAHKGLIEVDSKEGKGTRFRIYLPCLES